MPDPWDPLRARVQGAAALYQPLVTATCSVCRGPVQPGFVRCYQCGQHEQHGHGLLADAVIPVSYAIRGTPFAEELWRYKAGSSLAGSTQASSSRASSSRAGRSSSTSLLALLLLFLHDHGACVWRQAGMSAPDCLAVVPSGCGRPGRHPLLRMVTPYVTLPVAQLGIRVGEHSRDLDVRRFRAGPVAGARVLLLDDTWVSGASAQSAAAAFKLAGATQVAIVVLGRHLNPADPRVAALVGNPYEPVVCAVHNFSAIYGNG
jgi:hypothetical protein